jgi:tetratricopeptide (TPR) repeat protein
VALAELVEAIVDRVQGLSGSLGAIAPLVPARWLPFQGLGSTRFVGRLSEMWRIHSALHPEATRLTVGRTGPGVVQVRGLGGVGKSLLAEEYALRFGAAYSGGVFWLRAYGSYDQDQSTDLPAEELDARRHDELRHLAAMLSISLEGREPDELPGLIAQAIEQHGQPCLWVIDDLPNGLRPGQVRAWLAPHPLAHTLITTRSRAYEALASIVDLDVLSDDEAYELLTVRRRPIDEKEGKAAHSIVAALGCHALAVDVTGAAIHNQQGLLSYADVLADLTEPGTDELEALAADLIEALPTDHPASIARTLVRSIGQLGEEGCDFLQLAANLAPAPIPARLVANIFQHINDLEDRQAAGRAGRAFKQIASLSLATQVPTDDDTGLWLVHVLVARTVNFHYQTSTRSATLRTVAIAELIKALRSVVDPRKHATLRDVLPHARALTREASTEAEAQLLDRVARYDFERAEYRSALTLREQEHSILKRLLGPTHEDTLHSANNLGDILHALGELTAARDLQEETLRTCRQTLDTTHHVTLTAINNLGTTFLALGHPARARKLFEEGLAKCQQTLGPIHPHTLSSINNLAVTLMALGDWRGAQNLFEQVRNVRREVLGPTHPQSLQSISNTASTLLLEGDLEGARRLFQESLDAHRHMLGPAHPDTLTSMQGLGVIAQAEGDLEGARRHYQEILDAQRQALGPVHPDTLLTMLGLAEVLWELGDRADARQLQQSALDSCRRYLGPTHPLTLLAMKDLGSSKSALQRLSADRTWLKEDSKSPQRQHPPETGLNPHSFQGKDLPTSTSIGRNQRCPCGSGKKYKHCHLRR